jgi:uroporphyrinogen-III synthase
MAYAVLTRESIEDYAPPLAALGLDAIAMPVTRTVAPPDPDALSRALARTGFDLVYVASPRAAEHLIVAAGGRPLPPVWVVGPATLLVLERAGIAARHPDGVRDGDELASAIVLARRGLGGRVLVPRAADGRAEPLAILRNGGLEVVDVIAYATAAADPSDRRVARGALLLRDGAAAVCAVFAPSQVDALVSIVGPVAAIATRYCAIGDTTASALRAAGVADVAVAPTPTPEGMAQAAAAVYPARKP